MTDVELWTDVYYMMMVSDSATATLRMSGVQQMAAAFVLPATFVFANPATAYMSKFGLTTNTVA